MKKITFLICAIFALNLNAQTITHSSTQDIIALNSVACSGDGVISDNIFYRSFVLDDFGINTDWDINTVEFGIEALTLNGATEYPVTVSIYTTDATFPTGNLTLISEVTDVLTEDVELGIHTTSIFANISAGSEIVVAINLISDQVDDGGNGLIAFQIGSNPDAENAPSYLSSNSCAITTPTTTAVIGFPDMHIVMNVIGAESPGVSVEDNNLAGVSVFPNPMQNELNVTLPSNAVVKKSTIYDILGNDLKLNLVEGKINTSMLSSGIYMLYIETTEGNYIGKIVKK